MCDIGDNMADFGSASKDIINYMRGGPMPQSPKDAFTMQGDQSNYLELLARLIDDDDEFKRIVAEWNKDPKTGKPNPNAYMADARYDAANIRGERKVPSYVDPYTARTKRY